MYLLYVSIYIQARLGDNINLLPDYTNIYILFVWCICITLMYIHYTHAAVIWPAYWKRGAFVVQTPQRIAYCVYMYVCMYIYMRRPQRKLLEVTKIKKRFYYCFILFKIFSLFWANLGPNLMKTFGSMIYFSLSHVHVLPVISSLFARGENLQSDIYMLMAHWRVFAPGALPRRRVRKPIQATETTTLLH